MTNLNQDIKYTIKDTPSLNLLPGANNCGIIDQFLVLNTDNPLLNLAMLAGLCGQVCENQPSVLNCITLGYNYISDSL